MTVAELRKQLRGIKPNAQVLVSSDEEGNSFHALFQVSIEPMKRADNGRYAPIYEYDENGTPETVVLWPS